MHDNDRAVVNGYHRVNAAPATESHNGSRHPWAQTRGPVTASKATHNGAPTVAPVAALNTRDGRAEVRRVEVLGARVSAVDIGRTVDEISSWVANGTRSYVCVTGAHGVLECSNDPDLTRIHNEAGLVVPDGKPMVWAGRFVGLQEIGHVRGADLMLAILERAEREGWSSFFYGGAEGVPELLAERLSAQFPGMKVAGCFSPPFRPLTPDEERDVVDRINASGADLVWVGLSTPKQERWMAAHRGQLHAAALFGVGAAFDFHSGRSRQAPKFVQRSGFEWLYRLGCEPRRLWRRYVLGHSTFVWRVLRRWPTVAEAESTG